MSQDAKILNVLFLCTGNSAGSILAEALLNHKPMSAHWGVADPAAATGDETAKINAFRTAFRALENRIKVFTNLPIRQLDKVRLQKQLNDIGKMRAEKAAS